MNITITDQSSDIIIDDNQNTIVVQKVELQIDVTPQEKDVVVTNPITKIIDVGNVILQGGTGGSVKPESIKELEIEDGETVVIPSDNICFTTAVENSGILEVNGLLQLGV